MKRPLIIGAVAAIAALSFVGSVVNGQHGTGWGRTLMFCGGAAIGVVVALVARRLMFQESGRPTTWLGWGSAGLLGTVLAGTTGNNPVLPFVMGLIVFAVLSLAVISPELRSGSR
jgi:peptidoglycan/LPS O-acetylase OafA/YrhL